MLTCEHSVLETTETGVVAEEDTWGSSGEEPGGGGGGPDAREALEEAEACTALTST